MAFPNLFKPAPSQPWGSEWSGALNVYGHRQFGGTIPVWAADLAARRCAKDAFRRIQRGMAARVVRAYRTVSHAAITVLAGWPPLEFLAAMYAKVYRQERELRSGPGRQLPTKVKIIRIQARRSLLERWDVHPLIRAL